jgi:putative two-component system response regulator
MATKHGTTGGRRVGDSTPERDLVFRDALCSLMKGSRCVEVAGPSTGHHSGRLRMYCEMLGRGMGLADREMVVLRRGAVLHDIGKLGIPADILLKPGALSHDERLVMERHTVIGEKLCRPVKSMAAVLPLIRHHHEHYDGTGYPDGLEGCSIPLVVRVLQVVDAYDALRSQRPYREAMPADDAVDVLRAETERGKWDPAVMEVAVPIMRRRMPLRRAG